eukprot:6473656-Amphidinium_carterae.1
MTYQVQRPTFSSESLDDADGSEEALGNRLRRFNSSDDHVDFLALSLSRLQPWNLRSIRTMTHTWCHRTAEQNDLACSPAAAKWLTHVALQVGWKRMLAHQQNSNKKNKNRRILGGLNGGMGG